MALIDDLKAQVSAAIDQAYLQGVADGVAKTAQPLQQAGKDAVIQLQAIENQISNLISAAPPPKP